MTQVAAPDRLQGVTIRPATPADSAPTYEVLIDAIDHLARTHGWPHTPRPMTALQRIPGGARAAIGGLLTRGWRYGDGMTVVLTSAPWGRWDRYVTSGGDALL